jgi:tRNA(fMet)-specific endonuclease VapC
LTEYLLDTNIVSYIIDGDSSVANRLKTGALSNNFYASVVTEGELFFGVLHAPSTKRPGLERQVASALSDLADILPITHGTALAYARIRQELISKGLPLPDNDLWIAGTALANDYVLVSHDAGFKRIKDLQLEDWLGP